MNAMNKSEMNAVFAAQQQQPLGDYLFSVLDDGTCVYEAISDDIVIDIEG